MNITSREILIALVAYEVGAVAMFTASYRGMKRASADVKRATAYANEMKNEVWMHLPDDVKEILNTRAQFYNISLREGLR